MSERISWREGHAWVTNAVLCLFGLGLILLTRQFVAEYDHFTIGFSGCSGWSAILYVASIIVIFTQPVNRATFGIVIGFAVALNMVTLFPDPFSSSDIYRYVWDGVVQHAQVNPYRYVPGDPALTFLRKPNQDTFDSINRRDYARTIYPPVAQMVYFLVTFISPTVTAMKAAMLGFECLTAWALFGLLRAMGRPRTEILVFAWCPLLVWEIGGAGHVDAAVFAFVAMALLFRYRDQPVLTGLFLGLAVMTKFYPLVLFPALYRRGDWKMPATVAAVCAVGYACYLSVGKLVFGFLFDYTKEEGIDTGTRFFLLDWLQHVRGFAHAPVAMYMVFCAVVLGGISLWAWRHATVERAMGKSAPVYLQAAMLLAFAMMLLFSPHYPWYVVWLVPFFLLVPNLPLLAYVMGVFYGFTTQWADPGPKMFLLNKVLYGLVAVAFLVQVMAKRWGVWERFRRVG